MTEKLKINKARFFITGEDLLTVSKLGVLGSIFDPESRDGVVNDYPFFSNVSIGLNVNF